MTLFKTLNGTRGSFGHGDYTGYLPKGKRPGKWLPKVTPVLCESGYHVCRDLSEVLTHAGPELYEVEVRGTCVEGKDKAAWEQARLVKRVPEWDQRTMRLWAIDCARRVMYISPDHELLDAVLDVCVAYAEYGEEWAAARDAAWAAARHAAWAAKDAAWTAARDAAWDAVWTAARAAETQEQVKLLQRYLDGEQGPFVETADA